MKRIIDYALRKIEGVLVKIGDFINQTPTVEENKKAYVSKSGNSFRFNFKMPTLDPKREKVKSKEIYSHKGSGYKGKGNINRDAATFNQPRKGLFPGRKH